jgi:hypothetical protein
MNDRNDITFSDEAAWLEHIGQSDFWDRHAGRMRPLGIQAPPAPAPAPVPEPEPNVVAMSVAEFAQYRREIGLDSSDFIGVQPWSYRHLPQPTTD